MTDGDGPALHGWLIIDKPVGPGSTQVVSAVKRALRGGGYARVRVGHGGTLDPLASGVLPVALGEATKLSGRMLDADKAYDFTIGFGVETETLDLEGAAVATSAVRPHLAEIAAVLPRFTGPIAQVPPAYSALKVDGRRAYDLARAGEAVTLATRAVTIHSLELLRHPELVPHLSPSDKSVPRRRPGPSWGTMVRGEALDLQGLPNWTPASAGEQGLSLLKPEKREHDGGNVEAITLRATVSKGTYIRSLARDIARALDTVGHVTMLRRTRAGPFALAGAISLDTLADLGQGRALETVLLPLAAGLDDIPALPVTPDQAAALRQGRRTIGIAAPPGLHLATDAGVPVALVEIADGALRIVRGINL